MVSTDGIVQKAGLPAGEYKIVAWDLDTTGRRLIDEFCHVAGYTSEDTFSQYVMPYKDLDSNSKRRHMVKTVTVGLFRMLKDLKTGKFLKTKSEISALFDFLNWLEKVKGEDGPAIILLNYETYKLAPCLLLEALKRYELMDRFTKSVKGFGDCYGFVKQKCDTTLNSFSLRVVSKVLLDKDDDVSSATDRARLAYQVVQHLTAGESGGEGDASSVAAMVEAIREHTSTVDDELKHIENMKVTLQRQNTLKPVFAPFMSIDIRHRKNATSLRRLIVEALLDYETLKSLWDEGRERFEETINSKLTGATEDQRKEICKILSDHFDPDVNPEPLERKPRNPRKSNRRSNAKDKDQAVSLDIPSTPDTTASNTSVSSPSKSNGVSTPQEKSPTHKPTTSNGEVKPEQAQPPKESESKRVKDNDQK